MVVVNSQLSERQGVVCPSPLDPRDKAVAALNKIYLWIFIGLPLYLITKGFMYAVYGDLVDQLCYLKPMEVQVQLAASLTYMQLNDISIFVARFSFGQHS